MKYRLAIFDFDGTLADSFPWFLSVLGEVAKRHGFRHIEPEAVESLRGADTRTILRELRVPLWKLPAIATDMRALARRDAGKLALYEGIPDALRALSEAGVSLAVVSSNAADNIERVLGAENAARIAHWSCGASLFGKASKLKRVVRSSAIPAENTIYVGDELRDGDAARDAGISFGAVTWGYSLPDALQAARPHLTFTKVEDLARQILGQTQERAG